MLSLGRDDADHVQSALGAAGGFAWWYADLVAPGGDGAVLIWSFGLPFLPGARERPIAATRPALSVAIYERGDPSFYVLQEGDEAGWDGGGWRFGRSELRLEEAGGRVALRGVIDLDLPAGDRFRAALTLAGRRFSPPSTAPGAHRWTPIAPCARGVLAIEGARTIAGRAYFDANASTVPLDALGIADWRWGRVAFPDHELVYFFCEPAAGEEDAVRLVLRVEPDGSAHTHEGVTSRWLDERWAVYGLRHARRLELASDDGLAVQIDHRHLVDDGPFYLRFLTQGRDLHAGVTGLGSAERVVPDRVDRPWQRPFVRMRRHRVGGDNSIWLPLFTGSSRGRLGRLVRHWAREVA